MKNRIFNMSKEKKSNQDNIEKETEINEQDSQSIEKDLESESTEKVEDLGQKLIEFLEHLPSCGTESSVPLRPSNSACSWSQAEKKVMRLRARLRVPQGRQRRSPTYDVSATSELE